MVDTSGNVSFCVAQIPLKKDKLSIIMNCCGNTHGLGGKGMGIVSFLLCVVQYVLIGLIILAVGIAGAFLGIRMRKKKNAKLEEQQ